MSIQQRDRQAPLLDPSEETSELEQPEVPPKSDFSYRAEVRTMFMLGWPSVCPRPQLRPAPAAPRLVPLWVTAPAC